jgi:hypothetical protein
MPVKRPVKKDAPRGRPTLYKREYCQKVVEMMGQGLSIAAFCSEIGVGRDAVYNWQGQYPEFDLACKAAKEASQRWWEKLAMLIASGKNKDIDDKGKALSQYKNANHGMVMFMMGRRFPDYYARKETIIESTSSSRKDVIRSLSMEERIEFISKYQKLINELSEKNDD